ncbi:hypothetical protein HETIRDRAFT_163587 [Heterobasidion irregulare TC 32-1]|uniref:Uncharacterized protein n=1 Tax=Heterobasidion irregulare (strain TC 32-1) TaxID=747525 RepID=W4KDL3_HETIT|nr:uncharacterized protein HETIRDRAFT_163587 [Heterobasidion irregulare TC 32-1]ETW83171.1 hypothetical protein HETIRDRAFT_163587 [Heterobasidion irregulare TC 32-1]
MLVSRRRSDAYSTLPASRVGPVRVLRVSICFAGMSSSMTVSGVIWIQPRYIIIISWLNTFYY